MKDESNDAKVGIVGLGVVGGSMATVLDARGIRVVAHDKFKPSEPLDAVLDCGIVFLCLPTPFSDRQRQYDKSALFDVGRRLGEAAAAGRFDGLVVVKSTVEPGTTRRLAAECGLPRCVHNPEFLTARSAVNDFEHQSHIVVGTVARADATSESDATAAPLLALYGRLFPAARITACTSDESEMIKLAANNFYACKIMFFNEVYLACQAGGMRYDLVRDAMLANGWIHPQHTRVPGPDGALGYGGMCFPKDTRAMEQFLIGVGSPHALISAASAECDAIRSAGSRPNGS